MLTPATRIVGLFFILLTAGCVGAGRAPPTTGSSEPGVTKTDSPDVRAPTTVPAEQTRKKENAKPGPGKREALPPLDLAMLEKRLRETSAIGVFTKITLKNQIDDLLDQFRAHYQGRTKTSLTELRQPYEMLLLKVLSLVQDSDPSLARVIVASREVIWGILADPAKFSSLNI